MQRSGSAPNRHVHVPRSLRRTVVLLLLAALPAAGMLPAVADEAPDRCVSAAAPEGQGWHRRALDHRGDVDWLRFNLAEPTWVLITLGDLPANYRLGVYAADCRTRLAVSNLGGRRYEQVYRRVPAGRLNVKISGVSGAHSNVRYAVGVNALPPGLHLRSVRGSVSGGRLRAIGEVLNNTSQSWTSLRATLELLSPDGQVQRVVRALPLGSVGARQRAPVVLDEAVPASVRGFRLTRVRAKRSGRGTRPLPETGRTVRLRPSGDRAITTTFRNSTSDTLAATRAAATMYGPRGQVLDAEWSHAGALGLDPSESRSLRLWLRAAPAVDHVAVKAEGERSAVIAHRGHSAGAPENTLAAIRRAVTANAPWIEIDVQVAKDGTPVLLHDLSLERTTDVATVFPERARSDGGLAFPVADFRAAELAELDAGAWFGERFAGEGLPTLAEALRTAGRRTALMLELKRPAANDGLEDAVADVLETTPPWSDPRVRARRLLMLSFDRDALRSYHARDPVPRLGLIYRRGEAPASFPKLDADIADAGGLRAIVIHAADAVERPGLIAGAHRRGLRVHVFTVDDAATMTAVLDAGIDGVTSNRPDLARDVQRGWAAGG